VGYVRRRSGVYGRGEFRKILIRSGGRQHWGSSSRTKREEVERGQVVSKPGSITPHRKFKARRISDEGGGGSAHAVFQWVSAAVLLSDDGRDGVATLPEGWRWYARGQCGG